LGILEEIYSGFFEDVLRGSSIYRNYLFRRIVDEFEYFLKETLE
jgi:hypothetical protein